MSIILVVCFVLTLYMYYVGSSLALNIAFWIFAITSLLYMAFESRIHHTIRKKLLAKKEESLDVIDLMIDKYRPEAVKMVAIDHNHYIDKICWLTRILFLYPNNIKILDFYIISDDIKDIMKKKRGESE